MNKDNYMNQLFNKVLFTFILLGFCAFTFAQTIQVLNIPDHIRTDYILYRGYRLNANATENIISANASLISNANLKSTLNK